MKSIVLTVGALCAAAAFLSLLSLQNPARAAEPAALPDEVSVRLADANGEPGPVVKVPTVKKTDAEWKEQLSPIAYNILRQQGTERPFSCGLLKNKENGIYYCAGCDLPLFASKAKFDSGTGWPSYYETFAKENVVVSQDTSDGMVRDELSCARCGGHLGHVFSDGPAPTGLRYCIDGFALTFRPTK